MLLHASGSASCDPEAEAAPARLHTATFIECRFQEQLDVLFAKPKTENATIVPASGSLICAADQLQLGTLLTFPPPFFSSRSLIGCLVTLKEFSE